jgi:cytochrome c-type biogenesis protein CcmH
MNSWMVRAAAATLLCAVSSLAGSLSPAQQRHADILYTRYVAPCCWRQSVAVHPSPEGLEVKRRIDTELLEGRSDSEIKEDLIRTYGHGILMEPEGIRALAAYGVPAIFIIASLLTALRWLRLELAHKSAETTDSSALAAFPDLELES